MIPARYLSQAAKVIIALVIVMFIWGVAHSYFQAHYESKAMEKRERLHQAASSLNIYLNGRIMALSVIASEINAQGLEKEKIRPILQRAVSNLGVFNIAVFTLDGTLVIDAQGGHPTQTSDYGRSFVMAKNGQAAVSNRLEMDGVLSTYFSIRVPIFGESNEVVAVLAAGIPIRELTRVIDLEAKHMRLFVIDSDGNLLYHPEYGRIDAEKASYTALVRDIYLRSSGMSTQVSTLDGELKNYFYSSVDNSCWRIVLSVPVAVMNKKVFEASLPNITMLLLLLACCYAAYSVLRLSRRYNSQMESLKMERMTAVNQLAAGIAHEIRNPLTSIKGFIQLMTIRQDRPAPSHHLEIIMDEIKRIEQLINEFRLLAKPVKSPEYISLRLDVIVGDVVLLMESQALGKNILLAYAASDQCLILGDEAQLKQIFINLIRNAIDAVPEGGEIAVTVMAKENTAFVAVEDNGVGIPEALIKKLGTPFFTTKDTGTGLGLSVCFSIIEQHGGRITIASTVGRGSVFTVELPLEKVD